jgi:hypothetical protein
MGAAGRFRNAHLAGQFAVLKAATMMKHSKRNEIRALVGGQQEHDTANAQSATNSEVLSGPKRGKKGVHRQRARHGDLHATKGSQACGKI